MREPTGDSMNNDNRIQSMVAFLALRPEVLGLLAMAVLVGLGERMAERFLPLYLYALGGGALSVGLLNGLDNLLSALYSYPGGYLSDRLGYKRALVIFNLLAMLGYVLVILVPSWQAVILGSVLFLSWSALSLPATMDLVAKVLPQTKRTMGVSMHSLVRRIPMALGPLLGGLLIGRFGEVVGVRLAFAVALILGAISLVLQQLLIKERRPTSPSADRPRLAALLSPSLRRLLLSDILVRFCEQIPYAFVVIWAVEIIGITPLQFGILTAIEMATAVAIYIPVAYLADRSVKKPFVLATFVFFSVFPLLLLVSRTFEAMLLAFVVRGLKEFGEPTRKALIMDLAPEGRKAGAFGTYYLVRDVVVSIAAFGGAILWDPDAASRLLASAGAGLPLQQLAERVASPSTNLLVAAGFGLLGTVLFAVFGSDLARAEPDSAPNQSG